MKLDYLLADPSGNKTILVLTPVPKEQHSTWRRSYWPDPTSMPNRSAM